MIYHYTSVEVLYKLLGNIPTPKIEYEKEELFMTFRATHTLFLNDTTENNFIFTAFKQLGITGTEISYLNRIWGERYLLSFSEKPDDLYMWNMYGNQCKGVAIGFNQEILEQYKQEKKLTSRIEWMDKCEYVNLNKLVQIIKRTDEFKQFKKNREVLNPLLKLFHNCLKYKHEKYSSESEYRILLNEYIDENYYVKDNKIVPYINVDLPLKVLIEIWLGPATDYGRNKFSIERILKAKVGGSAEYANVTTGFVVKKSEIPYSET